MQIKCWKTTSETRMICKIVDAVYAMGRTIEESMGIKQES